MTASSKVVEFDKLVKALNKIVFGGEIETVTLNGIVKPTISNFLKGYLASKADLSYVNTAFSNVNTAFSNVNTTLSNVNTALLGLTNGAAKFYPTLAAANADIANIAMNQSVTIGEAVNGGIWYKATAGATSLTKSPYDPLNQFQGHIDTFFEGFLINEGDNWSTL